jgi:hypothetical protein
MEEDFRALLTGASAVTALVPVARINWGAHPQGGGAPYLVLTVIGNEAGLTMQGPDGLWQGRVQVDCCAPDYAAAKIASRAVIAVLHSYRGGGFRLVEHVATRDSREGGSNEAERAFRVSLDFITNWRAN